MSTELEVIDSDLAKMNEIKDMYLTYPKTAEWMLKMELFYRKSKRKKKDVAVNV
jgi:hypothetical protein